MADLDGLSQAAQAALATKHQAREQALPKSRATIRCCANAIRAIHREDFASAHTLVGEARGLLDSMRADLRQHPDIYFAGFVEDAQKEFAEAAVTLALVQQQPLPTPDVLGVEWAPFLNGMGEAVGELRRHTLDALRHGNLATGEVYLREMDDIFGVLTSLDFPDAITNNLRRTADVARGIIEKTRGDLTAAVVQANLADQMHRLIQHLGSDQAHAAHEINANRE